MDNIETVTAAVVRPKEPREQRQPYRISDKYTQLAWNLFAAFNLLACAALAIVGYRMGIFTSVESLQAWVNGFGPVAPIIFIVFQAVQVILPIIPGGVSLAGGVVIFGPWWGFVYNYLGICLGSLIVFGISRGCGKPLMYRLFKPESIEKYENWTSNHGRISPTTGTALPRCSRWQFSRPARRTICCAISRERRI